jgi:hypothetical protein
MFYDLGYAPALSWTDRALRRPFESGFPISLCEGIRMPLEAYWPRLRNYI